MKYFDFNATTPVVEEAKRAWNETQEHSWANASALYDSAVRSKRLLSEFRQRTADCFGVESDEIVFCSGSTEAANLLLRSYFDHRSDLGPMLVATQEHSCIYQAANAYGGDRIQWFNPLNTDLLENLEGMWKKKGSVGAVTMMAANNETGQIYNWQSVQAWCEGKGIPFFCDATQWMGKYPMGDLGTLDYCFGSAHKFGGPKGIGIFKQSKRFHQFLGQRGGGHEHGIRAGTEDLASIAAAVVALENANEAVRQSGFIEMRLQWKQRFLNRLKQDIPGVHLHAETEHALWNTVSIAMPDHDAVWWIQALEKHGFAVGMGSACASTQGVSRILKAMHTDEAIIRRTLRLSSGGETSEQDWNDLADVFVAIWQENANASNDLSEYGEVISIDDL